MKLDMNKDNIEDLNAVEFVCPTASEYPDFGSEICLDCFAELIYENEE